jgi:hypothetical protein
MRNLLLSVGCSARPHLFVESLACTRRSLLVAQKRLALISSSRYSSRAMRAAKLCTEMTGSTMYGTHHRTHTTYLTSACLSTPRTTTTIFSAIRWSNRKWSTIKSLPSKSRLFSPTVVPLPTELLARLRILNTAPYAVILARSLLTLIWLNARVDATFWASLGSTEHF